MALFGKRIGELNRADIQRVVEEQLQEGTEPELKEALPSKKGRDPWLGGRNVGDYARNELVAEIIAFANARRPCVGNSSSK